jgi:hypothetical protein
MWVSGVLVGILVFYFGRIECFIGMGLGKRSAARLFRNIAVMEASEEAEE